MKATMVFTLLQDYYPAYAYFWKRVNNNILIKCATQELIAIADAGADAASVANAIVNADADTKPTAGAARATIPVACM